LLVSAVITDACNLHVPAIAKVSAPELGTGIILAAVPANSDALPLLPLGNTGAYFIDNPGHFMAWNARVLNSRPGALHRERVAVTDTTGLHPDAHVSRIRHWNVPFNDLEARSRLQNLRGFHSCYFDCCGCQDHPAKEEEVARLERLDVAAKRRRGGGELNAKVLGAVAFLTMLQLAALLFYRETPGEPIITRLRLTPAMSSASPKP
jgi:hypothetical protein